MPLPDLLPGLRALEADASHYLCRVLRLRDGDAFVAFDPDAHVEANACIMQTSETSAVVSIGEIRAAHVVAGAPLSLVYALAKGNKVDAVVRDATELGATNVILARTDRSVIKADEERTRNKLARLRRIAEQAARQCGRADPPGVDGVFDWDGALAHAATIAEARYCLDVRANTELGPALVHDVAHMRSITVAIGPEGGLTDREVDEARKHGFVIASLGRFVLRTETVAAAVLGAIRVLSYQTSQRFLRIIG
ncbi:MAG: 16S rRNA (uracil(1498)-N(3))-methyltransferase [Polyangiaceae bacterium]|nr:16S rRNA (uracil(1498)-N(3))-methyltransferase [Polyangiaceae bacterium]